MNYWYQTLVQYSNILFLSDCCSIAALSALLHFKRPDVSIVDNDVHIHTAAEKEPIPMVLHHYPVCVSYCLFDDGRLAVADPSAAEERTADSSLVFGLNSFRELCCLNLGGTTLTSSTLLLQCAARAARRAKFVVDYVKETLELDKTAREDNRNAGFTECVRLNKITALAENRLSLRLRNFKLKETSKLKEETAMQTSGDEEEDNAEESTETQKNGDQRIPFCVLIIICKYANGNFNIPQSFPLTPNRYCWNPISLTSNGYRMMTTQRVM